MQLRTHVLPEQTLLATTPLPPGSSPVDAAATAAFRCSWLGLTRAEGHHSVHSHTGHTTLLLAGSVSHQELLAQLQSRLQQSTATPGRRKKGPQREAMVLLVLDELDALMTTDQSMLVELFRLPQVGRTCLSKACRAATARVCFRLRLPPMLAVIGLDQAMVLFGAMRARVYVCPFPLTGQAWHV